MNKAPLDLFCSKYEARNLARDAYLGNIDQIPLIKNALLVQILAHGTGEKLLSLFDVKSVSGGTGGVFLQNHANGRL